MKVISDMVLYVDDSEIEAIEEMNYWCSRNDSRCQQFEDINVVLTAHYLTGYILAMASKDFPYKEFIEAFWTFPWKNPEKVVLIVNHESDNEVKVLTYKDFKNEAGSSGS